MSEEESTIMKNLLSFKEHIDQVMHPYRIWMPSLLAFTMAFVSFYAMLLFYSHTDRKLANILAPHISALLEIQDGPEINRFIHSVSRQKGSQLKIIQNGVIVESTLVGERFTTYTGREGYFFLNIPSLVSSKYLISKSIIERLGGPKNLNAKLILKTPIGGIILISFITALMTFVLIFFIIRFIIQKSLKIIQKSIFPINILDKAIKNLKLIDAENKIPAFQIREFENIRETLLATQQLLFKSNQKLATNRAKQLSIKAYKNLIHDLHTPVAALKQNMKILNRKGMDEEQKIKSLQSVSELAEQILNQVTASKGQLTLNVEPIQNRDIRECIEKATDQAEMSLMEKIGIEVKKVFPDKPLYVKHDPIMLGRAVSNLVTNAIEACKNIVEVKLIKNEEGQIHISISDDGNGLNEIEAGLYIQGRKPSTKKNGVGMGLSSAHHIIKSHGGRIVCKSSNYGGSCFELKLQNKASIS